MTAKSTLSVVPMSACRLRQTVGHNGGVTDPWSAVWAAIDARRIQLGWTKAELYRRTRTSEATYLKMARGVGVRDERQRVIAGTLGWTESSIEQLLAGYPATLLPEEERGAAELGVRVAQLEDDVSQLREAVATLAERLAATAARAPRRSAPAPH